MGYKISQKYATTYKGVVITGKRMNSVAGYGVELLFQYTFQGLVSISCVFFAVRFKDFCEISLGFLEIIKRFLRFFKNFEDFFKFQDFYDF